MDYKTAGVDIEAGRSFVDQIKHTVKSTHRPEVMGGFGGFNGMMRIPEGYEKPVLVSGTADPGNTIFIEVVDARKNTVDLHVTTSKSCAKYCAKEMGSCKQRSNAWSRR